nr:TnsD family transposase [Heliobacterium chlorum]
MVSFPHPYPDELLYSVFARYHVRSGNLGPKMTVQELFDSDSAIAVVDLPSHLGALIENMPQGLHYTADDLVDNHTLYPFYSAFLEPLTAKKIRADMIDADGKGIHYTGGIMASNIPVPSYLRYCKECALKEQEMYGELFWHRAHQLPGVLVCAIHGLSLINSTVIKQSFNRHQYITASLENCMPSIVPSDFTHSQREHLLGLAVDAQWLLNQRYEDLELNWLQENYLAHLSERGLVTPKGHVRQEALANEFIQYYGRELLCLLGTDVSVTSQWDWLKGMTRMPKKAIHPIRHLLMMRFLTGEAETFLSCEKSYAPFGQKSWPCLNPVANHRFRSTIGEVIISRCSNTGKPIGTFRCCCGFVYSRRGPDQTKKDRFRFGRIKAFGQVWEERLRALIEETDFDLKETARYMGVDTKTVIHQASKLELKVRWLHESANVSREKIDIIKSLEPLRERYRDTWRKIYQENPNLTKTGMRQHSPKTYAWLYRNDRLWLNENSPIVKKSGLPIERIDWTARDTEILEKVKSATKELLNSSTKPQRITKSRIGKITGTLALLEKHQENLPRTMRALQDVTESIVEFQIRRVRWAVSILRCKNNKVEEWKIKRIAGLKTNVDKAVLNEIKQWVCNNKD